MWLKCQSAKNEKSADSSTTMIIKQKIYSKTHNWILSFLFCQWTFWYSACVLSIFFNLWSPLWSSESIKFKNEKTINYLFPCLYFFWTTISFFYLVFVCLFVFFSTSTIFLPSTTRGEVSREGTVVGEGLVARRHSTILAVSVVLPWKAIRNVKRATCSEVNRRGAARAKPMFK